MNKILNRKVLIGIIIFIITAYVLSLVIAKPRIANDTAAGFCMMYGWEIGDDWNVSHRLVDGNLLHFFQSWWAPGQFMIPWFFIKTLGLSAGNSVILAEILSLLLLSWSYRRLMRFLGVDDLYTYLSLILLLISRALNNPMLNYNADIYLVSYSVCFIHFYLWSAQRKKAVDTLLLFILAIAGMYLKNSFILVLMSLLFYDAFSLKRIDPRELGRIFLLKAVPVALAIGIYHRYYIRLGENIQESGGLDLSVNNLLNAVLKPGIATLLAPFSFNNLLGKISEIFSLTATNMEDWSSLELIITAAFVFPSAIWIFKPSLQKLRHARADGYLSVALSFFITYNVFYIYAMLTNKAIATDDRLFLPLIAMLGPFLVKKAFESKVLFIAFALACLYSGAAYINDIGRNIGPHRTRLVNDAAIDGHIAPDAIQPYDSLHGIAYLSAAEYCFLVPGKKYVTTDNDEAMGQLANPANTVVYDSAGYIKIRMGR